MSWNDDNPFEDVEADINDAARLLREAEEDASKLGRQISAGHLRRARSELDAARAALYPEES